MHNLLEILIFTLIESTNSMIKKGQQKLSKKKDYGVSKVTEYIMQKLNLSLMCNTWHTILSYNFHTLSLLLSYLKILVEHSLFITYANAKS